MMRLATCLLLGVAATACAQPIPAGRGFRPGDSSLPPPPVKAIEVAPIVPVEWRLLAQPSVREDIGLTAAQERARGRVEARQTIPYEALFWGTLGGFTREMAKAFKASARDEFWTKTLTKAQRTRLRQIEYQLKERAFGAHVAIAMAARDLGLRPDQLEDVTSIKGQRVEEIAKLVTSGERFEKVKTKVQATNGDTYDKIAEMLTRTQRERLKELKGKAFAGPIDPKPAPEIKKALDLPTFKYPAALFGVYDFEIRYLDGARMWLELRIDADQQKLIRHELEAWEAEYAKLGDGGLEKVTRLHERTAKALDKILTPKQRKRFDEIMARRRLTAGGPEAACGYPAVVSALKLTPIQLKALRDGKPLADVLTKNEVKKFETLLGEPAKLGSVAIDPVMDKARDVQRKRDDLLTAARIDEHRAKGWETPAFARRFLVISDRLRLSAGQIKKLRDLAEDEPKFFELIDRELSLADTPPVVGAARGQTAAGAVAEQFRQAVEEQCWTVLDEKQQSIARQIYARRK